MAQVYRYPAGAQVSISAIGTDGQPVPLDSILIGGEDPSGNLKAVVVDAAGHLIVGSSVLPTGAATSANQVLEINELTAIDGKLPATLGQKAMASSLAVAIASDQSAIPVTGPLTDTQLRATAVPVSGPLTDVQLRATAVPVSLASQPLPTGAATEATLSAFSAKSAASLTPFAYDYLLTTYRTTGNGIGQIDQVVYKSGGSGGTTVRTLTMAYDASDRLSTVTAT